jgi:mannitol/fructose-specific phosphotransferase system IIA component (Ntr-type)
VVQGDTARCGRLFDEISPKVPVEWTFLDRWSALPAHLQANLLPHDLVVVLSARRGSLAWHRELERVPALLPDVGAENFLMVYPAETGQAGRREFRETVLPAALTPERIVFDLPRMPYEKALDTLLRSVFAEDLPRLRQISTALAQSEREFSNEVLPGVVVPHGHVAGLADPLLFLGISDDGVDFPGASQPAHLIFLLLSPPEEPQEHLRTLAEVVRLVGNRNRVHTLRAARTVGDLIEAFGTSSPEAEAQTVRSD